MIGELGAGCNDLWRGIWIRGERDCGTCRTPRGSDIRRFMLGLSGHISNMCEESRERRKGETGGLIWQGESTESPTDGEETQQGPALIGEATASGVRPSCLLLIREGSGRSGALGRYVSALASRKALCRDVSLMNLEDVSCDLGSS